MKTTKLDTRLLIAAVLGCALVAGATRLGRPARAESSVEREASAEIDPAGLPQRGEARNGGLETASSPLAACPAASSPGGSSPAASCPVGSLAGTAGDRAAPSPSGLTGASPDLSPVGRATPGATAAEPSFQGASRRSRLASCVTRLAHVSGPNAAFDPAAPAVATAALALGREGVSTLTGIMEDERAEPDARAFACNVLEAIHDESLDTFTALNAATRRSSPLALRRAATRAIAVLSPAHFRRVLVELSDDRDPFVRIHALLGRARSGDQEALLSLETQACAPGPGTYRAALLAAIYDVGNLASRDCLERCRANVPAGARPAVSVLLARAGRRTAEIEADVIAASQDAEHPERRAAAEAILAAWKS